MPASASDPREPTTASFFVYILRCADDSLYVGHTTNIEDRLRVHNEGRGALWTACRRPVVLIYHESHPSESHAIARERQLKRWTHAKKLALIAGDRARLRALSKRRTTLGMGGVGIQRDV